MTNPLVLNYSHPLTDEQRAQLHEMLRTVVEDRHVPVHVPDGISLEEGARVSLNAAGLSAEEWQTTPLLLILPGLSALAAVMLADVHGRSGHFPSVIVIRPVRDAPVTTYSVREIINLQAVRERRRASRLPGSGTS